jgi:hypothetical protein
MGGFHRREWSQHSKSNAETQRLFANGSSINNVLDVMPESGTPNYEQRRAMLESLIASDAEILSDAHQNISIIGAPSVRAMGRPSAD